LHTLGGLQHPKALVLDPAHGLLYAVARGTNDVHAISLSTLSTVERIPVGVAPFGADLVNGVLYVANYEAGTVARIDIATRAHLEPDLYVGRQPSWVGADPVTGKVYVVMHGEGGVAELLGDTITRVIGTGRGAFSVAVDSLGRRVYVGNRDDQTIAAINADTGRVVQTLHPGGSPFGMAVHEASGKLYVLHGGSRGGCPASRLAVYDRSGSRLKDITVGDSCDGGWVRVNPVNGRVYIAATAANEVWILNSDETVRAVLSSTHGIGTAPFGLAADPSTSTLYVGNKDDGTISIIADP